MKVAISANEVGTRLKDVVKAHLTQAGYEVVDVSDKDIFYCYHECSRAGKQR